MNSKYNDYQIISDKDSQNMRREYQTVRTMEVNDLQDIFNRMTEQKDNIYRNNSDGKMNNILEIFSRNLNDLSQIIHNTNTLKAQNFKSSNKQTIFSKLTKSLFARAKQMNASFPQNKFHNTIKEKPYQNRFHNTISTVTQQNFEHCYECDCNDYFNNPKYNDYSRPQHNNYCDFCNEKKWDFESHPRHECDSDKKMITMQIDLLRLMILFISLRPKCPYLSKICSIADNQFSVLLSLIN